MSAGKSTLLLACLLFLFGCEQLHTPGVIASELQFEESRIPQVSAHRGGQYAGYPENSLQAFQHMAGQGQSQRSAPGLAGRGLCFVWATSLSVN